jgi:DNA-binding LacI/PurR family transcriptional regulator
MRMNISDIARLSGVSITTVSRVINHKHVKEEIRDRVLGVIKHYDYHPDPFAQYLGRKREGATETGGCREQ